MVVLISYSPCRTGPVSWMSTQRCRDCTPDPEIRAHTPFAIHAQDLKFFCSYPDLHHSGEFRRLFERLILWCSVDVGSIDGIASDVIAHKHDEVEPDGKKNPQSILMIPDDVCIHGGHEQNDGSEEDDILSHGQHFRRRSGFVQVVTSSLESLGWQ
jgi:hypothetical protein